MKMWQMIRSLVALGLLLVGGANAFADDAEYRKAVREVNCLTEALYYEGRGGLRGEQIMQGMVILARAADREWDNSICGVVEHPNAFSYKRDAKLLAQPIDRVAWERAYEISRQLLRDAWVKQFLPRGAGCVRMYKVSDDKLSKLSKKARKQLGIHSGKGLSFFETKLRPVFTVGSHTFYEPKNGCNNPMPTI